MTRAILTPGAETDADDGPVAVTRAKKAMTSMDPAAELAALREENARLKSAQGLDHAAAAVVYTPVTPKGREALAASAFAGMTTTDMVAKIDAGEVREPTSSVLCADGWYAPRVLRG